VTDAVSDAMEMATDEAGENDTMLFGVLDFTDAFWMIPLHKSERRFFTTKVGQTFYVFLKTAQGSRGAPLTWSRFGALVARLMQGVFKPRRGRINLYVDDSLLILVNTLWNCRRDFAMVVLLWLALGLPLALRKAEFGSKVTWTSGVFKATTYRVLCKFKIRLSVSIKPDTVADVRELTEKVAKCNVVSTKELRSFVGKRTAVASLVFMWSPFLKPLWASLTTAGTEKSMAPRNCVWVKQFQEPLVWIQAFLAAEGDMITRTYTSDAYFGQGLKVEIDLDASPWGLGGILRVQNRFEAYFADPIGQFDTEKFGFNIGDCKGQQTWECLATLVAMRLWMSQWRDRRICLRVRSDSTTALRLLLSLKSTGSGPNFIGREIALDVARGSYKPDVAVHLPGVANAGPDALSRLFMDNEDKQVPSYLASVRRDFPPQRNADYYVSNTLPSLTQLPATHTA